MADISNVYDFLGKQINVGLSAVIGVTVSPLQTSTLFKYSSGGTLYCGGSTTGVGAGYLVSANEVLSINSSGTIYFAAGGATAVLYMLLGLGQ